MNLQNIEASTMNILPFPHPLKPAIRPSYLDVQNIPMCIKLVQAGLDAVECVKILCSDKNIGLDSPHVDKNWIWTYVKVIQRTRRTDSCLN